MHLINKMRRLLVSLSLPCNALAASRCYLPAECSSECHVTYVVGDVQFKRLSTSGWRTSTLYDSTIVFEGKGLGTCVAERSRIHKRAHVNATKTAHDEEEQTGKERMQFLAD